MIDATTIGHEAHLLHRAKEAGDWNEVAWHLRNLVHLWEVECRRGGGGFRQHIRQLGGRLEALGKALRMEGT